MTLLNWNDNFGEEKGAKAYSNYVKSLSDDLKTFKNSYKYLYSTFFSKYFKWHFNITHTIAIYVYFYMIMYFQSI